MIDVITCRGTGEPFNGGNTMLTFVTRALDTTRFRILGDCDYPASVGPVSPGPNLLAPSERDSIQAGLDSLAARIRSTDNPVGVLGYSLGALVVTALREAQARGQYADCQLAWTACVANPRRREGDSINPNPVGFGINGQRGPILSEVPHLECANPRDVITSCPTDSPLRTFADGVSAFSFAEIGGWTADLAAKLEQHRFQPATLEWWLHPIDTWRAYDAAAKGIVGFLTGQTHIRDYIEGGYCQRLADAIHNLPAA